MTERESVSARSPRIVVGVDGSEASIRALRFALEEARLRGALLHLVHTFPSPTVQGVHVPREFFDNLEKNAEAVVDRALEEAADSTASAGEPEVVRSVIAESPVRALVDASEGATLLVLGSRGLGGFQSLLLGSVSSQCVHHAKCPVTVVR